MLPVLLFLILSATGYCLPTCFVATFDVIQEFESHLARFVKLTEHHKEEEEHYLAMPTESMIHQCACANNYLTLTLDQLGELKEYFEEHFKDPEIRHTLVLMQAKLKCLLKRVPNDQKQSSHNCPSKDLGVKTARTKFREFFGALRQNGCIRDKTSEDQ